MLRQRIRYLLVLLASGALYIFYVGYTSWLIFMMVLLLPIASLILFLIAIQGFTFDIQVSEEQMVGEDALGSIKISTATILPLSSIRIVLQAHNAFRDETMEEVCLFSANKESQRFPLPFHFEHIGMMSIQVRAVDLYDLLGLFRIRKVPSQEKQILILPQPLETVDLSVDKARIASLESEEEAVSTRKSNGTQDLFSLHPYQEGDGLSRIHWKLSVKQGEWMVREFGEEEHPFTVVYYESGNTAAEWEQIYTRLYSLSCELLKQGIMHEIQNVDQLQEALRIQDMPSLHSYMVRLLDQPCQLPASTQPIVQRASGDGLLVTKNAVCIIEGEQGNE